MDISTLIDIIDSTLGEKADVETTERLATALLGELQKPAKASCEATDKDVVVSISGPNNAGVLAAVAASIGSRGLRIRDVSQTCIGDVFNLVMLVEANGWTPGRLQDELSQVAKEHDCMIAVQHKQLYDRVHNV